MTRQERLDKLMSQGMGDYQGPPHYPSGAPYMDNFELGENEAPPPPASPWKVLGPVLAVVTAAYFLRLL